MQSGLHFLAIHLSEWFISKVAGHVVPDKLNEQNYISCKILTESYQIVNDNTPFLEKFSSAYRMYNGIIAGLLYKIIKKHSLEKTLQEICQLALTFHV